MSSTAAAIQVAEFVRALAFSWKSLAAYPAGHPTITRSLDLVDTLLAQLRGPAGEVILGIAADGLIYGTTKIDSGPAQKLAHALYARRVAILRLSTETTTRDIEIFLRLIATAAPTEQRAIWEELTSAGVVNINLQPVNYSAIHITDGLEEKPKPDEERPLWEEVLRALLENRQFSAQTLELPHVEAADEWSRMIAEHVEAVGKNPTFDPDATFGIRIAPRDERQRVHEFLTTTIGQRIAQATGRKKQNSLEQAMQLLHGLAGPLRATVLRGVVQALATDEEAGVLLREFASELPNDEVLDALRYLSSTTKVSSHAMTLLQSLTNLDAAADSPPTPSVLADVVRLFGEEDLERFNPSDHQTLLGAVAIRIPDVPPDAFSSITQLGDRMSTVANAALLPLFTDILFDLIGDLGVSHEPEPALRRLESAFRSHLDATGYDEALAIICRLQQTAQTTSSEELRRAIRESIARSGSRATVQTLIDTLPSGAPHKAESMRRLAETLAMLECKNLVLALAEEENRSRRRRLFDFIVSLGSPIVPDVRSFLGDERWYVVRNMIALLRAVQDRTSLTEVHGLTRHPDLRVRLEAIKSLFTIDPASVPRTLLDDLFADRDSKRAATAVALVGAYAITEGVDPLLRLLKGNDIFASRRSLRVAAIRALGEIGEPSALADLQRFFTTSRMPWPSSQERYAAWESLQKYPADARAGLVAQGQRSPDPKIRALCGRLART